MNSTTSRVTLADRTALQDSILRAQSLKRSNNDMRSRISEV
jgi:hypothetical protein